ncbi:hypothetical protein [Lysobacter sp. Root690]|uniref:hypothetical protein n=1 Tax=Lysobacter sp. Root690 TaxID=1736588 RepID=UPI000B272E1D|nr:hypothetical protein [Lysobacter sp. Root690]
MRTVIGRVDTDVARRDRRQASSDEDLRSRQVAKPLSQSVAQTPRAKSNRKKKRPAEAGRRYLS